MTPAEVILMTRGYLMKRSKEWEQTRSIAYTVESTKPRKGRLPNMRDWMPLPTDKFQKIAPKKVEEMRSTWEQFKNKQ